MSREMMDGMDGLVSMGFSMGCSCSGALPKTKVCVASMACVFVGRLLVNSSPKVEREVMERRVRLKLFVGFTLHCEAFF